MKKQVAIIGSGPAALMLAATLHQDTFDVIIYERNFAPARKFLVAGDGGFNLTHSEDLEPLIARYTPSNYIEKTIRAFSNIDLQNWLKNIGIETFIGSSKRVFPLKGIKPIEVLNAFLAVLKNKNVQLKTKHEWIGWNDKNELVFEHENNQLIVKPDITIFALGGASWQKTGSNGKWTHYFKSKDIEIIPFQPSNCSCQIAWDKTFISYAAGEPLKNIGVFCEGKERKGELVMTSFGIEGGAMYAFSPEIRKQLQEHQVATVFIDLKPTLSAETIKAAFNAMGKASISHVLQQQIKINKVQIALLKSILSKEDFTNTDVLASKIKQLPLHIIGMASIEESISTVGGIALFETDDNFQLHKLPNHYAIGEMLDWDAPTGGYLLQACFSMGHYVGNKLNATYELKNSGS